MSTWNYRVGKSKGKKRSEEAIQNMKRGQKIWRESLKSKTNEENI